MASINTAKKRRTIKKKARAKPEAKRQPTFRAVLADAEGRSEFVIIVFADIRGFSQFSRSHESPDTAMLIKRFYLQLIDEYFVDAAFFKPTGDGLLIVYPYNEKSLDSVAKQVVVSTIRCHEEFPGMLSGDPMINFETPKNLGFGIARGTACCLHSGRTTIDYSGHLLNLAGRLMELARPSGIVIDGAFGHELLPDAYRDRFAAEKVFIRSLAESEPVSALYLQDSVKLPKEVLHPIQGKPWKTHKAQFKVADLRKLGQYFYIDLSDVINEAEPISMTLNCPLMHKGKVLNGYSKNYEFKSFTKESGPGGTRIRVDFFAAAIIMEKEKVPRTRLITFKIDFVGLT